MGNVAHQDGADAVGNGTHALPIPVAAVGGTPTDDELRTELLGLLLHIVVIDGAGLLLDLVADHLVHDAAEIDRATVAQVSAVVQIHAHEGVTGVQAGQEHGHVGLCAAMGLHICPAGTVQLLGTLNGDGFALVHYLASAVVAFAGIAFSILVCHDGAHGLHHLVTHEILGGDQLYTFCLTFPLLLNEIENLFVSFHDDDYNVLFFLNFFRILLLFQELVGNRSTDEDG